MDRTPFDLDVLLGPGKLDSFLSETWEKSPHVIQGRPSEFYSELFSLSDLDEVIAYSRPKFMEAVAGDVPRNVKSFVQGWLPDTPETRQEFYPGIGELRETFASGKSVIIRSMQERWPAIASLCRSLEIAFHCPVHANLYYTPPNSQAFPAHIDTHEVFALQLEGAKHWRLYGQLATLPMMEDSTSVPRSSLGSSREIRMESGDLLYLPRGYAHDAFTTDRTSLHLTIGVHVYRWADLLHQALVDMTRQDARFRESLPRDIFSANAISNNMVERCQELLQSLARDVQVDEAARHLDDRFFGGLKMLPGAHFVAARGVDEIGLDTTVERRAGVICRVFSDGLESIIEFPGGRVAGPVRIVQALTFIGTNHRFSVGDLPDELGDKGKLALVQRLVRAGMLTVVPRETAFVEPTKNGAMSRQMAATIG